MRTLSQKRRRQSRLPETRSSESFKIPVCSVHGTPCQKDDDGNWHCPKCADDWLKNYLSWASQGKSEGGVVLPSGVHDERLEQKSFRDVYPNRRVRRATKRSRRGRRG